MCRCPTVPNLPIHVYIVDADIAERTAYARVVQSAMMHPQTFGSVEDFMRSDLPDENACVICDIKMPGISGLEVPSLLTRCGHSLPMIFVTGQDASETRVRAQYGGAAGYFRKPIDGQALLDAIYWALARERGHRA